MSNWLFDLIDRDGVETTVENPQGWDDIKVSLTRDKEWHGVWMGYALSKLSWHGEGAGIIKCEYDLNGVNGYMGVRIRFMCNQSGDYDVFYNGSIDFTGYDDECGDLCIVTAPLEDVNNAMLVRNNYEQSVDLLNNIAFDGVTELTDYDQLNIEVDLPARSILQRTSGSTTGPHPIYPLEYPLSSPLGTEFYIRPAYTINPVEEIPASDMAGLSTFAVRINVGFIQTMSPQLTLSGGPVAIGPISYSFRMKGRIRETDIFTRQITLRVLAFAGDPPISPIVDPGLIHNDLIVDDFPVAGGGTFDQTFDVSHSGTVVLNPGQIFFVSIYLFNNQGNNTTDPPTQIRVDWDPETTILLTAGSEFPVTRGRVWMVNEAISRTVEAITNDAVRFYSTLFGREDSQPYASTGFPCPSLMWLSNGLNIRGRLMPDGTQPSFFKTLRQFFDDLSAIWNIGMSVEPDLNRPGFSRLRFEDWRYFYQNQVGIYFRFATTIRRRVDLDRVFNRFQSGYNKWEAETFTGLDEFMTRREWRININSVDKPLTKYSDIIASPYAIEVTRRFGNKSEDWRYDNETFGICVRANGDGPYTYDVPTLLEEGYQISSVYDPGTCYNHRIDPARNAMRWFNFVMQGYRSFSADTELIFSKGDGNYTAEYGLSVCNIDAEPIKQNENIDLLDFDDINQAAPPLFPELIEFRHPMNYFMFKQIKDDPALAYKCIVVYCNGNPISGWINTIEYSPKDGEALITMIPKNYSQLPNIEPAQCEATVVDGSITLDNVDYDAQTVEIDFTEGAAGASLWSIIVSRTAPTPANATFTVSSHPATLTGIIPGTYSITVIPYCGTDPGANAVNQEFTIDPEPASIHIYAELVQGTLNRVRLNVSRKPGSDPTLAFSFKWGYCCFSPYSNVVACSSFPGANYPTPENTLNMSAGTPTVVQTSVRDSQGAGGYITKIVIYSMVGITAADIEKNINFPQFTNWTLEFI